MVEDGNLDISRRIKQDIMSYTPALAQQIVDFMMLLSANPYAKSILDTSVDNHDGSFYHRLPSGCFVFWELLLPPVPPPLGSIEGIKIRILGARFDFGHR